MCEQKNGKKKVLFSNLSSKAKCVKMSPNVLNEFLVSYSLGAKIAKILTHHLTSRHCRKQFKLSSNPGSVTATRGESTTWDIVKSYLLNWSYVGRTIKKH